MKNVMMVVLGCALSACGFGSIVIPAGFASGGVTGLCRIIVQAVPVPLSVMVFAVNCILFGLAYAMMGKQFAMKSLLSVFLFPVFLEWFSNFDLSGFALHDPLLAAVVAGMLVGTGTGMILKSDASSGGLDVVAAVLEKKTGVPISISNGVMDLCVMLGQSAGKSMDSLIYGAVVIAVISITLKKTLTSGNGVVQLMICSDEAERITDTLIHTADTGATLFKAVGGYRREDSEVVMCVVPYQRVSFIRKLIEQIDDHAFVTYTDVRSVAGRGFTQPR